MEEASRPTKEHGIPEVSSISILGSIIWDLSVILVVAVVCHLSLGDSLKNLLVVARLISGG